MQVLVSERKIWWIASYPKSGNTWVRMFVNAYMSGFPLDINSGFQYANGDNHLPYFQICCVRRADNLEVDEQVFIRPAAMVAALNMSAAKHVCLKTHHSKVQVNDIPLIYPALSGGAVYIVRDPRDVVISYADHLGYSIDKTIECLNTQNFIAQHPVTNLAHILTTWSTHVDTWTVKNTDVPVEVVRYEDMVTDTDATFRVILKGLGVSDIDEDRFKFALNQTTFSNLQKLEKKEGFREKGHGKTFFRKGKFGQWKMKLTSEQCAVIEDANRETMERYNYCSKVFS